MNAKQINALLREKGGYNGLNHQESNEVVKFVLRATPISTKESAINLLKGGMIIKIYKQFLQKVEEKFNSSQRRMVMMALEPIYGIIKEPTKEKGGEIQKEGKGDSSEEFYEKFRRMTPHQRNICMEEIKRKNPQMYKELSLEINLQRKYKGGVKKHFNQNLNNGLGHIKMKNEDGSFTYY